LINLTDDVDNTKHTVIRFENNKHNDSLTPYSDNVLLPKSNNDNSASTTDHFELDDSSLKADTKHLMELNAIATHLPLYRGMYHNQPISILFDCGASCNYVNPRLIKYTPLNDIQPIPERHVETADGETTRINQRLNMDFNIEKYVGRITAYVFPTKFDLILGRTWLKQCNPKPDWFTDSWTLPLINGESITIVPYNNSQSMTSSCNTVANQQPVYTSTSVNDIVDGDSSPSDSTSDNPDGNTILVNTGASMDYLITPKQADRLIRKHGANFCLMFIDNPNGHIVIENVSDLMSMDIGKISGDNDTSKLYWKNLINEYADVFRDNLPGLPPARNDPIIIDTGDARPVNRPPYKMSPAESDELKRQLTELLQLGLIRPSSSPWGAPVLFVRKKDGTLRMCIDYRALNRISVKKSYGIPNIDESLERLHGSSYFTTLDLKSGYHQMRLNPEDIPKTSFNTRLGKFEWLVAPFGLTCCPIYFQSLMNRVLDDCLNKFALVYLDDVLIFSKTEEEHRRHVRHVLDLLRKNQLICNKKKCSMAMRETSYLGFRINAAGILPDENKIKAIRDWPRPSNVQEVRQFVGLAQYFRKFCPGFAGVVTPLTNLTRGTGHKKRSIIWTDECQKSFDNVKKLLTAAPCLAMPDPNLPYRIECDSSDYAMGACLLQPDRNDPTAWHPIAFESKKLSDRERKYPAQERELAAILMALRAWRHLVDGCSAGYTVFTDHLPLKYFRTQEHPTPRLTRWISELEMYNPDIQYKKGSLQVVADALSRRDGPNCTPAPTSMEPEYIYAFDSLAGLTPAVKTDWPLFYLNNHNEKVSSLQLKNKLAKERPFFEVTDNDKVYRKVDIHGDGSNTRLVPFIPFVERADFVTKYHEGFGHCGYNTLINLLTPRGWWPTLKVDVRNWLRLCPACQVNSNRTHKHQGFMKSLAIPGAFERWHLDFIGELPTTLRGNRWIIVAVDTATNWPVTRAVPVASEEAVADFLYSEIFMNYGIPVEICTDRGASFCSGLVRQFMKRVKVNHKLTSAFHPRTNSKVERYNGILKPMLRKYVQGQLHRWDDFLQAATFATRIRIHSTTGYSPFYLTYGREPRLPGDIMIPYIDKNAANDPRTVADFTARELANLGQHRAAAEARMRAMNAKDKEKWDAAVKKVSFEPGDLVLLTHEGRLGLEPRYKGPFVVVAHYPDYDTYRLQTVAGEPLKSLVHIDRLKAAHGTTPVTPWYDPTVSRRKWRTATKNNGVPNLSPTLVQKSHGTTASLPSTIPLLNELGNPLPPAELEIDPIDPVANTDKRNSDSEKAESELQTRTSVIQNEASPPKVTPTDKEGASPSNGPTLDNLVHVFTDPSKDKDIDMVLQEQDVEIISSPPFAGSKYLDSGKLTSKADTPMSDSSWEMSPDSTYSPMSVQSRTLGWRGDNVGFRTKGIPEVQAAPRTKRKFSPIVPSGRSSKRNKLYSML
jgi:hypothetical protein